MTFDEWEQSDEAASFAGHYVLLDDSGRVVASQLEGDYQLFAAQLPSDAYERNLAGFVEPSRARTWPLKDVDDESLRQQLFSFLGHEDRLGLEQWQQACALLNEICVREGVLPLYEVLTDPTSTLRPVKLGYRLNALEVAVPEAWDGYADRDADLDDDDVAGSDLEGFEWLRRSEATYQRMYIDLLLAAGSQRGLRYGNELLVDERGRFALRYGLGGRICTAADEARLQAALAAGAVLAEPLPETLFSLEFERHYGKSEVHSVASLLEQASKVNDDLGCWWAPFEGEDPVEHSTEIVYEDREKQVAVHTSAKQTVKVLTFHDRPRCFYTHVLAHDRSAEDAEEAARIHYLYEKLCLLVAEPWPRPDAYEYPIKLPGSWTGIPEDAGEFDQVRVVNWDLLREQLISYRDAHPELELAAVPARSAGF